MRFIKELISDVKNKKELRTLDDSFVEKKILVFLDYQSNLQKKNGIKEKISSSKNYEQFSKSREHDFLVKNVRAELRKIYGVFIKDTTSKKNLLNNISYTFERDGKADFSVYDKLLSLHQSTAERKNHYIEIYKKIFSIIRSSKNTGNARNTEDTRDTVDTKDKESDKKVILDLACGLNPLSSIYIKNYIERYYASDISEEDCKFLREFFSKAKIPGEAFKADLTDNSDIEKISKIRCDICFLFKALDSLERSQRNISGKLLGAIDAKYIIVSFPSATISGKNKISSNKRFWFEKLVEKMNFKVVSFEIPNEKFYIMEKS